MATNTTDLRVSAEISAAEIAAFRRRMEALGVPNGMITRAIDDALKGVSREAARRMREDLVRELDAPEEITLRGVVETKPFAFQDGRTGGVRIIEPQSGWLRNLIEGGLELPSDGHRYLFIPIRKVIESPQARRAGVRARFKASGNLNRADQKALLALGRRSPTRRPYTRAGSYPAVQGVYWGYFRGRYGLQLRPERAKVGDKVRNLGKPRPLVIAARQVYYPPVLAGMWQRAQIRAAESLNRRMESAIRSAVERVANGA